MPVQVKENMLTDIQKNKDNSSSEKYKMKDIKNVGHFQVWSFPHPPEVLLEFLKITCCCCCLQYYIQSGLYQLIKANETPSSQWCTILNQHLQFLENAFLCNLWITPNYFDSESWHLLCISCLVFTPLSPLGVCPAPMWWWSTVVWQSGIYQACPSTYSEKKIYIPKIYSSCFKQYCCALLYCCKV